MPATGCPQSSASQRWSQCEPQQESQQENNRINTRRRSQPKSQHDGSTTKERSQQGLSVVMAVRIKISAFVRSILPFHQRQSRRNATRESGSQTAIAALSKSVFVGCGQFVSRGVSGRQGSCRMGELFWLTCRCQRRTTEHGLLTKTTELSCSTSAPAPVSKSSRTNPRHPSAYGPRGFSSARCLTSRRWKTLKS